MVIRGLFAASAIMVSACALAAPPGAKIKRMGAGNFPISASVELPPGSRIVYVSGTVPDAANPAAAAGSVDRFGDTEAQTVSVLAKVEAQLKRHGMTKGDVVMMRVFLVAPPGEQWMDFAGMMRGYSAFFGTPRQPNKPARSTMQVAGLVDPGWLVEIEVTAAQPQQQRAAGAAH